MKNVLILALFLVGSVGVASADEPTKPPPTTPIELSQEHKLQLKTLEVEVLRLQVEMSQLEKQHAQKVQQLQELGTELSKKLDETVLQYIKESDRDKYTLNSNLDLVPNE